MRSVRILMDVNPVGQVFSWEAAISSKQFAERLLSFLTEFGGQEGKCGTLHDMDGEEVDIDDIRCGSIDKVHLKISDADHSDADDEPHQWAEPSQTWPDNDRPMLEKCYLHLKKFRAELDSEGPSFAIIETAEYFKGQAERSLPVGPAKLELIGLIDSFTQTAIEMESTAMVRRKLEQERGK